MAVDALAPSYFDRLSVQRLSFHRNDSHRLMAPLFCQAGSGAGIQNTTPIYSSQGPATPTLDSRGSSSLVSGATGASHQHEYAGALLRTASAPSRDSRRQRSYGKRVAGEQLPGSPVKAPRLAGSTNMGGWDTPTSASPQGLGRSLSTVVTSMGAERLRSPSLSGSLGSPAWRAGAGPISSGAVADGTLRRELRACPQSAALWRTPSAESRYSSHADDPPPVAPPIISLAAPPALSPAAPKIRLKVRTSAPGPALLRGEQLRIRFPGATVQSQHEGSRSAPGVAMQQESAGTDETGYATAYREWAARLPASPAPPEAWAPQTPYAPPRRAQASPEPVERPEPARAMPPSIGPGGRPCVGACPPQLSRFAPHGAAPSCSASEPAFAAARARAALPRNASFPPPTVPASHPAIGCRDLRSVHIIRRLAEAADIAGAEPEASSLRLERHEVPLYAKKFGRLMCGAYEVEDVAPANSLLAKAALNRSLCGRVGIPKEEVWAALNDEVGDVVMRRLIMKSMLSRARQECQ